MKVILPIIFLINFIIVGCNVETEKYDIVMFATGYKIKFPFLLK